MKYIVTVLLIISFSKNVNAQGEHGMFAYFNTGLKFASNYSALPYDNTHFVYERLGGGNSFTLGLGYMVHPNIGFEVNANVLTSNRSKVDNIEFKSNSFHAAGSIILQAPIKKICHVYAKAGFLYSSANNTKMTLKNGQYFYETNFINTPMKGFTGSLGVSYPISNSLSLMFEVEEVSMQGLSKESDFATNDPSNTQPKKILYTENADNYTTFPNFPISYSCIGANVGIKLHIK